MCKAYDDLAIEQRVMFDELMAQVDDTNPEDWIPVVEAMREHLQIEAFAQVPNRGALCFVTQSKRAVGR